MNRYTLKKVCLQDIIEPQDQYFVTFDNFHSALTEDDHGNIEVFRLDPEGGMHVIDTAICEVVISE